MEGTAIVIIGVVLIALGVILEIVNIILGFTSDNITRKALKDEYYT